MRQGDNPVVLFSLCLNPNSSDAKGIANRAVRAIKPEFAKNERDRRARLSRRRRIMGSLVPIADMDAPGILPAFRDNILLGSLHGVRISGSDLIDIIQYWAAGVHRHLFNRIVPLKEIAVYITETHVTADIIRQLETFTHTLVLPPAFKIGAWHVEEAEKAATIYLFQVWGEFRAHAYVEQVFGRPKG